VPLKEGGRFGTTVTWGGGSKKEEGGQGESAGGGNGEGKKVGQNLRSIIHGKNLLKQGQ